MPITNKDMEEMIKALRDREQIEAWNNSRDYDRSFMRNMQEEIQEHWRFMRWLKMTYPEALHEYMAVKDVERSANQ